MRDYDVDINFRDGSVETIKVHASNRAAALVTAIYSFQRWDWVKQDSVEGVIVRHPKLGRPGEG